MHLPIPHPVTLANGKITGVQVHPEVPSASAVVLYLHGGGGTYTEGIRGRIPQLPFLAALGIPGYSINRPDNVDSVSLGLPTDADDGVYQASAEIIYEAAEDIWQRHQESAPGIIIQGCSVGSAVAFTLAAYWCEKNARGEATWPLLGVIAADIGVHLRPGVAEALGKAPDVYQVEDALNTVAYSLDFGPSWAKDDLPEGEPLTVPRSEIFELVGGWPRHALETMRKITVPVMWRVGEFDPLWNSDPENVAIVREALGTSSPYVDAAPVRGAIHPLFESTQGHAFTIETASFMERCRVLSQVPQIMDPTLR